MVQYKQKVFHTKLIVTRTKIPRMLQYQELADKAVTSESNYIDIKFIDLLDHASLQVTWRIIFSGA